MRSPLSSAVLLLVLAAAGCHPFAGLGEHCVETPCRLGLLCVDGVCEEPVASDAGPPPCARDDECVLRGNADGRECVEGVCAWASCSFDLQCGTRICDQGACAPREACANDDGCDDGRLCDDNACRSPCEDDDQCTGLFEACDDEGRCRQQCFADLMCLGGLCNDGLCEDPECATDDDCEQDGSWACNGGRCESFLPCDEDGDCFDPNFRCNEIGRCEERALCTRDDECGLEGLCIEAHCRPTTVCLEDESLCDDDEECVAGRCTNAPGCRRNADCAASEVCSRGSCRAEVTSTPSTLVVETALGACHASGEGACHLVLFEGEQARVRFGALDEEGMPVLSDLSASLDEPTPASLSDVTRSGATVTAELLAGTTTTHLRLTQGDVVHLALQVTVVPSAPATETHVLVVDGLTGAQVSGAAVTAAGVEATTGSDGLAAYTPAPSTQPALVTARALDVGIAVADLVPTGDLRLVLPSATAAADPPVAAGFSARVTSSGDEVGPVGLGLALASQARLADATLSSLFGPAYVGVLDVPLLGAIPVPMPAATTLQASLPLVGQTSDVRPVAYATTAAGPRSVTAFEGRYETDALFALTGAGDEVELALDLAGRAEGMDALWVHVGDLQALPLVADTADVDGDGDALERTPDFANLPSTEVTPTSRPTERTGLLIGPTPAEARPRVLAVSGLLPPGYGFVPTGVSAFVIDDSAPRQLKATAPIEDGLTPARRAVVVQALFDDGSDSRLQVIEDALLPTMALGAFLKPPEGAMFLDGVPLPGERLLLLPEAEGATTYRVFLDGGGASWQLYLPAGAGGKSVTVDEMFGGLSASLGSVEVLRLEGDTSETATYARFRAGAGPPVAVEDAARARASAR